jgi:cytochrome c5
MTRLRAYAAIVVIVIAAGGWGIWRIRSAVASEPRVPTIEPSSNAENDITKYSHFGAPGMAQIEVGARVYEDWCIACHADTGLGLTGAWLAQWDPEHQDCWQAKCHSVDHPSDGFVIPRYVPPVVGDAAFGEFDSAADLQAYLKIEMPYPEKGVLDDQIYWALTAYLLNRNGITYDTGQLGPDNAASIRLGY